MLRILYSKDGNTPFTKKVQMFEMSTIFTANSTTRRTFHSFFFLLPCTCTCTCSKGRIEWHTDTVKNNENEFIACDIQVWLFIELKRDTGQ